MAVIHLFTDDNNHALDGMDDCQQYYENVNSKPNRAPQSEIPETKWPHVSSPDSEAHVSGHPREAEKVSATGAGRLREYVNTEFVHV